MTYTALTIAGSDPSGGAGLQADLKTMHDHDVFGMSAVTLVTVQNTVGVRRVETLPAEWIREQIQAVVSDIPPQAAKTGALGSAEIIRTVAECAREFDFPLVVDPVMCSKHGDSLIDDAAVAELTERLLPLACLVTPNRFEAERISGIEISGIESMVTAAAKIASFGVPQVCIKGGSDAGVRRTLLWSAEQQIWLESGDIRTSSTHGSGCVMSAAVTSMLARGAELPSAVRHAHRYVERAIRQAPGLGQGFGPTHMQGGFS